MGQYIDEIIDLRHLEWSKICHSSGTAGSFLKAQDMINGVRRYYKLSSYDSLTETFGNECVIEFIVDRLLSFLNIPHLSYDMIHAYILINDHPLETYLCASDNFRKADEYKTSFENYYEINKMPLENTIDFCKRMGWEKDIYVMLMTDYLILNRDRHGANIEVLKSKATKNVRLAPMFDHGLSLIFSCKDDEDIRNFDVLEDKKIQCFLGGNSAYENLKLIPKNKMPNISKLKSLTEDILFNGIENIVSDEWKNKVFEMINKRAICYEDLRTSK